MATTNSEILKIANAIAEVAKLLKQTKFSTDQALARNTVEAFDWAGAGAATANTALQGAGISYDATEVSNAIGSLADFQTWWVTHGGNFEKLVDPIV